MATLLRSVAGFPLSALSDLMMTLVALLTPPVLSHLLAVRWGREAAWLRYATAFNWCHWVILLAFALMLVFVTSVLTAAGMAPDIAIALAELCWAGYGLAMHWFLARRGLGVGRLQALLLLAFVELGTGLLVIGPLLLAGRALPQGTAG